MLKYFEKAWCYVLLIILVILLRKMVLHDPNGNSQIIKRFVKCSLSYWVLAHPIGNSPPPLIMLLTMF